MKKLGVFAVLMASVIALVLTVGAQADQGRRLAGPFCIGKASLKNLNGTLAGLVKPGKTTQRAAILRAGAVRSVAKNQPCRPWEVRRNGLALPKVPGPAGPAGERGRDGSNGANGANGAAGASGAAGATGAAGAKGDKGDSIVGPKGDKGDKGDRGERGPRGFGCDQRGDDDKRFGDHGDDRDCGRGPRGEIGPRGPAGPAGPPGPKGDTGPAGPRGERGERGEKGEPGGLGDRTVVLCVSVGGNLKYGGPDGDDCDPGHAKLKVVIVGVAPATPS